MKYKTFVKRKTTKELEKLSRELTEAIDNKQCFSSRDVILREYVDNEINKRFAEKNP